MLTFKSEVCNFPQINTGLFQTLPRFVLTNCPTLVRIGKAVAVQVIPVQSIFDHNLWPLQLSRNNFWSAGILGNVSNVMQILISIKISDKFVKKWCLCVKVAGNVQSYSQNDLVNLYGWPLDAHSFNTLVCQMEEARRNSGSLLLGQDNVSSRGMQMIGAKVTRRRGANIAKSLPNLHLPPPPPTPPPPPPPAPPVKYWLHFPLSSLAWWTCLNLFPLSGFFFS